VIKKEQETRGVLHTIARRLDAAGIPWAVFAGCATWLYGAERPVTDVDILIRGQDVEQILELLPEATVERHGGQVGKIALGNVELVPDPVLTAEGRRYPFLLDDEMLLRRTWCELWGLRVPVLSPEDNIVFKAILQRGPEQGKHDLEDVEAVLRKLRDELDLDYIRHRAAACGAEERVLACLIRLELKWEGCSRICPRILSTDLSTDFGHGLHGW
jgi:hypothetical protein